MGCHSGHMCGKYIVTCAMDVEYVRIVGPGITVGLPPAEDHGVPLIGIFARVVGHLAEEELQHFGHILHLLLVLPVGPAPLLRQSPAASLGCWLVHAPDTIPPLTTLVVVPGGVEGVSHLGAAVEYSP